MLDMSHLYPTKVSWKNQLTYQVAQLKSLWFQMPSSFHFVTFFNRHIWIPEIGAKLLQSFILWKLPRHYQ